MAPKIFLISGKARHGKDTFADIAIKHLEGQGKKCLKIGYGDMVKIVCNRYYGCTMERNDHNRSKWQEVGTDKARRRYPDVWVDMVVALIKGIGEDFDYIFIPDVRFLNELEAFKGATTIRVNRPDFDNGLRPDLKTHESETSLDNYLYFDYFLTNRDLLNLESAIKQIITGA